MTTSNIMEWSQDDEDQMQKFLDDFAAGRVRKYSLRNELAGSIASNFTSKAQDYTSSKKNMKTSLNSTLSIVKANSKNTSRHPGHPCESKTLEPGSLTSKRKVEYKQAAEQAPKPKIDQLINPQPKTLETSSLTSKRKVEDKQAAKQAPKPKINQPINSQPKTLETGSLTPKRKPEDKQAAEQAHKKQKIDQSINPQPKTKAGPDHAETTEQPTAPHSKKNTSNNENKNDNENDNDNDNDGDARGKRLVKSCLDILSTLVLPMWDFYDPGLAGGYHDRD
jgi:hypothetical protein